MNAYDIYEFYIEAKDLKGQAHKVKVESAYVKEVFNPGTKNKDKKIILRLVGKQKVLSLNKTRTGQMIDITGTPNLEKWAGTEIVIKPGKQSGKDTVIIEAPAQQQPKSAPASGKPTRLETLKAEAAEDLITAYSDLWKAAGLENEDQQAILKECGGDFEAAFKKIAEAYAPVIG